MNPCRPRPVNETPAVIFNKTRNFLKKNPTKTFEFSYIARKLGHNIKTIRREIYLLNALGEVTLIRRYRWGGARYLAIQWCPLEEDTPKKKRKKKKH